MKAVLVPTILIGALLNLNVVKADDSPLSCGSFKNQFGTFEVVCNITENQIKIEDIVFNRGNCSSAKVFRSETEALDRRSLERSASQSVPSWNLSAADTIRRGTELNLKNNPLSKIYNFGDRVVIPFSCPNLLEFTVVTNKQSWTWKTR